MIQSRYVQPERLGEVESIQVGTGHTPQVAEQSLKARRARADQIFEATHQQVGLLTPKIDGQSIALQTFCIAPNGNIWVCLGGPYMFMTPDEEFIKLKQKFPPMIVVYSPKLERIQRIEMPFTPNAINYDRSEKVFFVGGDGRLARISPEGLILDQGDAPNMKDVRQLRKEVRAQLNADTKELKTINVNQHEKLEQRISELETRQKEAELSKVDTRRLASYRKRITEVQKQIDEYSKSVSDKQINEAISDRFVIKSIAIAKDYLFVAVLAADNYNYEIFRVNKKFEQATKVLSNQRGCCGRFDIQATGNNFWVADNIFFRIVKYDLSGTRLDAFGHKSATEQHGFGSCCNPMNLQTFENGDLLTAESSIGHIKRFSAEGKLVGYIGQAKIANGCKNAVLGFDLQRNIYYMLHQEEHSICILKPIKP